jgi:hypothetical protein
MPASDIGVTIVHNALKTLRDGLSSFVADCLADVDPISRRQWWQIVDEKRVGKLRRLPRDPREWSPDELLNTMNINWPAFELKTNLRYINPKETRKPDYVARGWINYLLELRNKTMHQTTHDVADVYDFLRNAELLLTAAHATEASERVAALRERFTHAAGRNPWSSILANAVRSPAIHIVKLANHYTTRALGPILWEENFALPHFSQTDLVKLELDLGLVELPTDTSDSLYSLWLVVDADQVTCLCPNVEIAPNNLMDQTLFTIPAVSTDQPLAFYGATGNHALYVILSTSDFPAELHSFLEVPQPIRALDKVAEMILLSPHFAVLKTEFVVD